jgi:Tol biopolymer transport system component
VSIGAGGAGADRQSGAAAISADGRCVAFASEATNLVAGDTNGAGDVFVRDLRAGGTRRVSVSTAGTQATGPSALPAISADGRYVAFVSRAADLVPGDTNGADDVFLRDVATGVTSRVSATGGGAQVSGVSGSPAISADGRYVAFGSDAAGLAPGPAVWAQDVYLLDRLTHTLRRINLDAGP